MLRMSQLSAGAIVFGIGLGLGIGVASAADIVTYDPPPTPEPYTPATGTNWTGPYVGVMGGYGWGSGTADPDGWQGGAYAGYNFQVDRNIVAGIEGDASLTSKEGSGGGVTVSNPWNASLRGRLGVSQGRYLLYGTGGVAVGEIEVDSHSEKETSIGWTAGAGVEAMVSENVTARAELRYTDLGSESFTPGTVSYSSTDVLLGVGVRF